MSHPVTGLDPDTLRARRVDASTAEAILAWRYPPPYAAYDRDADDTDDAARIADPANGYEAVVDADGAVIAYYCVGPDARPTGGRYEGGALDLAMGVRPDLTGRGMGVALLEWILRRVEERHGARDLRCTVASWNRRAQRTAERAGFRPVGAFGGFRHGDGEFVVMIRPSGAVP